MPSALIKNRDELPARNYFLIFLIERVLLQIVSLFLPENTYGSVRHHSELPRLLRRQINPLTYYPGIEIELPPQDHHPHTNTSNEELGNSGT